MRVRSSITCLLPNFKLRSVPATGKHPQIVINPLILAVSKRQFENYEL